MVTESSVADLTTLYCTCNRNDQRHCVRGVVHHITVIEGVIGVNGLDRQHARKGNEFIVYRRDCNPIYWFRFHVLAVRRPRRIQYNRYPV